MEIPDDPGPDPLRVISSFIRPLPPGEIERRTMMYRQAGTLSRETVILTLLDISTDWDTVC